MPEELYRRDDFIGTSAVLDDISGFDARHFGMSAHEARLTDPQHRLFLECAQHALENAGYPDERDGKRIGVYASTGYHLYNMQSYLLNNVLPNEDIGDWLAGMQVMIGNSTDFNATRVAYQLGLTGPAVNVQTACSSSLVAVQLAANSLLLDDCDIALVGAGALHVPQVLGYHHVKGSILSRTGDLRAFDAAANGTAGGTGVLAVVLKRLSRALADGDTVHGVIRGWGVCNDGAGKRTYAAPSARGQQNAVRRALDHAGVSADNGWLPGSTGHSRGPPTRRCPYRSHTRWNPRPPGRRPRHPGGRQVRPLTCPRRTPASSPDRSTWSWPSGSRNCPGSSSRCSPSSPSCSPCRPCPRRRPTADDQVVR
ncbi:hypothetical protein SMICM304S_12206 [Streptomyces microflavus]